jgi:Spy/CpxP family protein refolding chaperone
MRRSIALLAVMALAVALLPARAELQPADAQNQPAKPRKLRLVKPWADITSLNDEQKQQISEIHAEYVDRINQLRAEEEAAIMALLTDENKAELEANERARRQAAKERAAQRNAQQRAGGTTKPADE